MLPVALGVIVSALPVLLTSLHLSVQMLLSALQQRVAKKQISLDAETAAAAAAISANDMTKSEKVSVACAEFTVCIC